MRTTMRDAMTFPSQQQHQQQRLFVSSLARLYSLILVSFVPVLTAAAATRTTTDAYASIGRPVERRNGCCRTTAAFAPLPTTRRKITRTNFPSFTAGLWDTAAAQEGGFSNSHPNDNNNNDMDELTSFTVTGAAAASPPRPKTSLPPRRRRKKNTIKGTTTTASSNEPATSYAVHDSFDDYMPAKSHRSPRVLSEEALAEHVSNLYLHGPGGIMRNKEKQRRRLSETMASTTTTTNKSKSSTTTRDGTHSIMQNTDMKIMDTNEKDPTTTLTTSSTQSFSSRTSALENYVKRRQEQQRLLQKLDRHPALVLNADYQPMSYLPLSIWHWQETVKAVFSGKVTVVDVYPDVTIRAATVEVPVPSVIALNEYVPNSSHQTPAFTKRNVFLRDEYRCQYCGLRFHTRDLSLDHVVPRCRGGRLHWENAVTCCLSCNGKKGSQTVHEIRSLGMKLQREPAVPTQYQLASVAGRMLPQRVHPTWEPYLSFTRTKPRTGSTQATTNNHNQHHQQQQQHN